MSALVEELPDNKVRLTVDVPSADVHHAVEHAASDLAASVKIPGFRKGKVPMPVLVSRIGKERLFTEAIETHIAGWYSNAVARARIRPAEQPELDYELPASEDEDWRFTATVSVLPKPSVADWKQLQVPYAEPEVPEDDVEQRLRDQLEVEADEAFRRATLDQLVEASNVRVSGPLVDARTRTLLRELDNVMRRSGGSLDSYLQLSGESAETLITRLHEQAVASVAGDLVLDAAADQLGIHVSDDEVDAAFRERFEDPETVIEQAKEAGAYESEREAMRLARALDRIAADVERIPPEQAEAREQIWTPDKEKPKTETKLWTPGS